MLLNTWLCSGVRTGIFSLVSLSIIATGAYNTALAQADAKPQTLLNVSYDPTRELYAEINPLFQKHWANTTGQSVIFQQSHGGSGKQAL